MSNAHVRYIPREGGIDEQIVPAENADKSDGGRISPEIARGVGGAREQAKQVVVEKDRGEEIDYCGFTD